MEGTYPLPEAQLDRFLFKLKVYFRPSTSSAILNRTTTSATQEVGNVMDAPTILSLRAPGARSADAPHVQEHAVRLVLGTHPDSEYATEQVRQFVRYGSSPRGAQALLLASKVRALLQNRFHVAIEDIDFVARPALRHRMILNFEGQAEGVEADQIIDDRSCAMHVTQPEAANA
jgi:MoxR-like ATPase